MPTENRPSNTEMVSVPEGYMLVERSIWTEQQVEAATACITRLKGVPTMNDRALAMAAIDAAQCTAPDIALSDLLPAPQPHPEPIAWMVGTAFWWTKEEAERDAAATGLPIVGLGPTTDAAEVERLEYRIKTQRESIRSHVQEVDRLRVAEIKYGLKIEERNALLRKCLEWITSARDGVLYPIARDFEGVVGRNAEGLGQATPDLIDAVNDALSASAEPEAKS